MLTAKEHASTTACVAALTHNQSKAYLFNEGYNHKTGSKQHCMCGYAHTQPEQELPFESGQHKSQCALTG